MTEYGDPARERVLAAHPHAVCEPDPGPSGTGWVVRDRRTGRRLACGLASSLTRWAAWRAADRKLRMGADSEHAEGEHD